LQEIQDHLQKSCEDFGKNIKNIKKLQNFKIYLAFLSDVWYNTVCCDKKEKNGVIYDEIL